MKPTIVGVSKNINRIKELIDQVADTGLNTIVYGETGVGKELVVQNLYQQSTRTGKPFVKVNCAALPDTLLESEMFGYEQGAFTGAERRKRGKFEQASGGVLFLDEIGDMSLPLQAKLLHVLQGGDFSPLGSEKTVKMGAWVIAATNHELENDMANGDFREDLYYRLSTIKIHIEPLRNRPEDIPHLIDHYVKMYTAQFDGKELLTPSPETIEKLTTYHWPGNIRELQNVLKRLMILGNGEDNLDDMLMGNLNQPRAAGIPKSANQSATPMDILGFDSSAPPDLSSLSLKKIKKKAMDRVEKEVIAYVLEKTGWNRSKATKILKISYKTLLYKIKDLEIKPPESSEE
ncbi:MAG: sigma-54-dependent Fis family transcriptional regulator [Deltaproteobacteria bacterium]|nr:sigma-54-dependent Fis family transcriptional regulator [Deltaproteobacteria bacterium]